MAEEPKVTPVPTVEQVSEESAGTSEKSKIINFADYRKGA
jgi:hypothetical protein